MWTSCAVSLFLSLLLLSESTAASVGGYGLQIAQQTVPPSSVPLSPDKQQRYQEGVKLFQEGQELEKKGTKEGYQQALEKYQQALKIFQELGLRKEEAFIYQSIGTAYAIRSENLEAIEYFNKSLNISREVKQPLLEVLALIGIAGSYNFIGKGREALTLLKQAESISRTEKRFDIVAIVLKGIANTYIELSEIPKTIEPLNQALQIYRDILKDLPEQAKVLNTIGDSYSSLGQPKIALKYYEQALKIQQTRQDLLPAQAETLTDIGTLYNKSGEYNKALEYLNKAREIQQKQGLLVAEGLTIQSIAEVYKTRGDYQKSIEIRQQARVIFKKSGNTAFEAINMISTANIYKNFLGDNQKALEFVNEAIQLSKNIGYELTHANALNEKAYIYGLQGDLQKALEIYSQALEIAISIKNRNLEARTLTNIASTYKLLGNYDLSLRTYKKARQIYQQAQDKKYELIILFAMSELYLTKGDYPEAINFYNQSVSLSRKQENNEFERLGLGGLARSYELQKDFPNALKNAETALALSQKFEDKYSEASALNLIGIINQTKGNYKEALNHQQKALSLYRQIFVPKLEAQSLNNISVTHSLQKQYQQAIDTLNEALKIRRTLKDIEGEADTLYFIATNQRKLGKLEAALPNIEEAIKIVENIRGNVQSQDLRTSYFATVQGYYKFYIDLLMELHKKDPSKICEFTTKDQNTNKDITIKDKCKAVALHISERSRARGLVELLTEARANIRKGANPELLAEESRLKDLINTKEKLRIEIVSNIDKINNPIYKARADKFQTEIDELLSQQKQLETKIRQSSPKYANLKYPQPLTLPQIQQQLDKDTLLLEYSLGKDRSYLWAVTPNSIDSYELPKREEIEKAVTEFRETLIKCQKKVSPSCQDLSPEKKAQALKNTALSATKLSKIILAPVAEKLGKKRLVIVADGELQTIPFAALNDLTPQPPSLQGKGEQDKLPSPHRGGVGGEVSYQPLIVNHEIVNLPSVTAIATQRQELKGRKTAPKTLAILADPVFEATDMRITGKPESIVPNSDFRGNELNQSALKQATRNLNRSGVPRLEGTRTEANAILNIIPSSNNLQAFGFEANYNWVTNPQLSQYRFLHFATHGIADLKNPELSGIVLSLFLDKQAKPADKGYLRLGDIFNLDFGADLVVLSACETGLGKDVNGEGLVGLTRGLMYAGAERVAVSLWKVNDEGTAELMQEFYTQMLKQGKSPTVALRAAQLKLWENSTWKNPYYWSAFTLQGEWR
ncbi:tetratricopeptide repeat protein [Plectonema radiosum NIES-515]|uniref:Tetratricopeptide repeat protein n=1 Tax=Plectonema radiosum NIES-515 TaxID=2986073 RepID=A0ABT3AYN9_9CYAN|nr:CHAT domain-containing protein [Plectonema radiosum]MCV3214242.1 tetratricopeptide repeat protein [Plectonema radiosum NIES-515]